MIQILVGGLVLGTVAWLASRWWRQVVDSDLGALDDRQVRNLRARHSELARG